MYPCLTRTKRAALCSSMCLPSVVVFRLSLNYGGGKYLFIAQIAVGFREPTVVPKYALLARFCVEDCSGRDRVVA